MKKSNHISAKSVLSLVVCLSVFLSLFSVLSLPVCAASPVLQDGATYAIKFGDSNMCVNVQYAPTDGIPNIVLDSYNAEENEMWVAHYNSSRDAYYFTPVYRPEGSMNCYGGAGAQRYDQVRLYNSNTGINDTASLWKVSMVNGYAHVVNIASGMALDLDNGRLETGTRINMWTSNPSGSIQRWKFVQVAPAKVTETPFQLCDAGIYAIKFKNNMCLNVQFAPTSGTPNIVLDSYNGENNEKWICRYNSSKDAYYFTPVYRPAASLNCFGGSGAKRYDQARLYESATTINDTASLWKLVSINDSVHMVNVASGMALDVDNGRTAAGTRVNLWTNELSNANQSFTFEKVGDYTQITWPIQNFKINSAFNHQGTMSPPGRPYHSGMDLDSTNTTITAAADGKVVYTNNNKDNANGRYVILEHSFQGSTIKTLYAHLNSINVKQGSTVRQGDIIGIMGNTGRSSGPHLHFAIYSGSSTSPDGYSETENANVHNGRWGCTFYNPQYVINNQRLP